MDSGDHDNILDEIDRKIDRMRNGINFSVNANRELLWATIFHDSVIDSKWLLNKTFSPGRWAVGYQFLYVLYRILNEVQPRSILELGLGQSTRMTAQFAAEFEHTVHVVVEHDQNWGDFFKKQFELSDSTQLTYLKLGHKLSNGEEIPAYENFGALIDKKFDLICIDAPFGITEHGNPVRIDILDYLPDCLSDQFIILLDDYNRAGEKATLELFKDKLKKNKVKFSQGIYVGQKSMALLCSESLSFLTTL